MFQFTHPVWGATEMDLFNDQDNDVSIHAPRVGCDTHVLGSCTSGRCFNSRTPCGVRHFRRPCHARPSEVSIHAPRVGCDLHLLVVTLDGLRVSIHAPRVGCDDDACEDFAERLGFNSRTPCGVRLY